MKNIIFFICVGYSLFANSQSIDMDYKKSFKIDNKILNRNIEDLTDLFVETTPCNAQKLLGQFRYNLIYEGESLTFLGHKVTSLGLYNKEETPFFIERFKFEVPYVDNNIFYDLINYYGTPYTIIPKSTPYLPVEGNLEYYKNYGLENCIEFAWHEKGSDYYVTLLNLIDYSSCYPEKRKVIWITYRLIKGIH
ncbi:hypothetical protein [uncultured Croceitalea sp.]|uniref:hypothetical protein n=1 Tax=uncultured Croceitalea sp. TaxID=1798908 RepID=UPI00374E8B7A